MSNYLIIFNVTTTEYCKVKAKNETEALIKLKEKIGVNEETSLEKFIEIFVISIRDLDKVEQI